ncbi:winged helix-turn-helix domain-containing protein [Cellulomonas rhizosphaerae]|uniref:winged helix-turn-helix domain-containing protein n=1 Tax=Cellulomonas rhizosphaerae TaxID=2293719 RepID=UPI0018F330EA|nr:helix-turn-helix domain-containing protein [Cellulomonas rhizosphaerae]
MNSDEIFTTTDPEALRALAHPVRIELLDLLDDEGELTASRAAELTGQTVGNCSFHLRTLARYGYIERGERQGTAWPWRSISRNRELRADESDPESVRAVGAVAAMTLRREAESMAAELAAATSVAPGWAETVVVNRSGFWATREEMADLVRRVRELTEPFAGRWDDASKRPEGAVQGRLLGVVLPGLEAVAGATGAAAEEAGL